MIDVLLARRSEFLGFLQRRVGSPQAAEDLLQDALIRAVQKSEALREPEALVGWFYRVLENAVTDHHRRNATAGRTKERVEAEFGSATVVPDDAPARVCGCVAKLKAGLKQPYIEALDRVDLDELPVKDFAEEAGLTRSNAGVRLHRARQALRAEVEKTCGHCAQSGCTDCTCGS